MAGSESHRLGGVLGEPVGRHLDGGRPELGGAPSWVMNTAAIVTSPADWPTSRTASATSTAWVTSGGTKMTMIASQAPDRASARRALA